MTNAYRAVQWNHHKRVYDALVAGGVLAFLVLFYVGGKLLFPEPAAFSDEILLIRAFGTCAIVLLHLILVIGPLARLDARCAPLLYNRRHLGVAFFLVALVHALLVMGYYGGFGVQPAPEAVLAGYEPALRTGAMPFEVLGFFALLIFFLMAATSHDFWLANLGAGVWKTLHMLVYLAYGLVVAHVALGALQDQINPIYFLLLLLAVLAVSGLHVLASHRSAGTAAERGADPEWLDAGRAESLQDGRGRVVRSPGNAERIAVFRQGEKFHAVSNVCAHQAGPLGEGRILDGCITCPWHGYQYRPQDGCSPPPYTEKVPTYAVRVRDGRIEVAAQPQEPSLDA